MNKYEIAKDEDGEKRLEIRFRRAELNEIQADLQAVYPDFDKWMQDSVNRFFYREIVNTAIERLKNQLFPE